MHKHYKEIQRLAEAPTGTKVWFKTGDDDWVKSRSISWKDDYIYVVADGIHEEERKAFAEGKTIEYNRIGGSNWIYNKNPSWSEDVLYRVKPDFPTYETRWKMLSDHDGYTTESAAFQNEERIKRDYPKNRGWYKGQSITVKVN